MEGETFFVSIPLEKEFSIIHILTEIALDSNLKRRKEFYHLASLSFGEHRWQKKNQNPKHSPL